MSTEDDSFAQLKADQKKGWALFSPLSTFTTPAAFKLVDFAGVKAGERVLDVACGGGVVAITAALAGAVVKGLDLCPALLEDARRNAAVGELEIDFLEGDVEALPYEDGSFDVVLSQFGHMFAPRPEVAIAEMLRVLRPGGRIAFSTWPPDEMTGRMFRLSAGQLPLPVGAAAPSLWGDRVIVRERLAERVRDIEFANDELIIPTLSARHYRSNMEVTTAPVAKAVEILENDPVKLAEFRAQLEDIIERYFIANRVHQVYLMTRAVKI